ncbi:branched-chain alpha-keto acid dehydrogenase E2 component [Maritimibacter alkaliphilus HTCC2654]|uniref:Dihydrolipoamide acetyltransferase component of pyruvate dehydrogenase complex n=1 Tax=Maritimibacter alkaliphilus HTCC2654 TaxID=314271 RepID=A3VA46_9RHOB|nr:dihydrolipoamide acetyltransferase family protein [Maritimibacter alkaliphilus]EAQ14787.1 dihydrolipoamide acetyltransferase [Maritimibacter alkaliphilus HTCC2654]TYP80985.1 branched-chain alpha-keto acid dehydrogenase E2 component [Maritimibacter alkaliphilus HTCC2654]
MGEHIVKLPDIGEGVTEAELTEWSVAVGDVVQEDDVLAVVMTDKAAVEIPAPVSGTVARLGCEVGDTLAVGSALVALATDGGGVGEQKSEPKGELKSEQKSAPAPQAGKAEPPTKPAHAEQKSAPKPQPRSSGTRPAAAPWVRQRARDMGIALGDVTGTGPGGRILYDDLEDHLAAPQPKARRKTGTTDLKVTGLRRVIAVRMQTAKSEAPHFSIIEEVDVTELEATRKQLNDTRRGKLTVIPFVALAIVKAVREQPDLNAHFLPAEGIIRQHKAVHIGVATQTDRGLMVPVLHHAEAMKPWDMAERLRDVSSAARDGTIAKGDLEGSTITISSLGSLGAIATTPILNLPEVAVVGVNKMAVRPMWDGRDFRPRTMMNLSGSFDHRVVDGWDAAVFIARLKQLLETPALLFIGD